MVKKYFHELTREDFDKIIKSEDLTWGELADLYPVPQWCGMPNAVGGAQGGCIQLISNDVEDIKSCFGCDCLMH